MALRAAGLAAALALAAATASAQHAPPAGGPASRETPAADDAATGDTWIFSGVLEASNETFSGTLITGKDTAFELKLSDGATCDGGDLKPSTGLVGLSEIACTDGRKMRALFVPQGGEMLKVFGHVGNARFVTVAHLLGTQALPEPKQTAAPRAPEPPPAPSVPPAPSRPGAEDPG